MMNMHSINHASHRGLSSLIIALAVAGLAQTALPQESGKCAAPIPATDTKFKPGQVWHVKARSWEPDATATVLRVESLPKVGIIIHARIDHVAMHTCPGNPVMNTIQHSPITRDAFDQSISNIILSDSAAPDFKAGYEDWRTHCGGVYSISIAEILAINEKTARANMGCA
jgi:hypothetical protein